MKQIYTTYGEKDAPMNIGELLDAAKRKKGTFGALSVELECHQNRFSEWRKGKRKPNAGEIVRLAEIAGLPVFQTLAAIEAELDEKNSEVWKKALRKLAAAKMERLGDFGGENSQEFCLDCANT